MFVRLSCVCLDMHRDADRYHKGKCGACNHPGRHLSALWLLHLIMICVLQVQRLPARMVVRAGLVWAAGDAAGLASSPWTPGSLLEPWLAGSDCNGEVRLRDPRRNAGCFL